MTGRGKRRKKKELGPTGVYAATAEVDEGQAHASDSIATSNQQTTVPIEEGQSSKNIPIILIWL